MRRKQESDGIQLLAVTGSHVVLLGWDMTRQASRGVLGFAIHRTDHEEDEAYWLSGMKTFAETDPGKGPGAQFSTRQHPIQGFTWSDFTAKPGYRYTYRVAALRGTPAELREEEAVTVRVTTELDRQGTHAVWFNRGAAASQEYARRFQDRKPSEVGEAAYRWLSRGLEKALLDFIDQAKGEGWGLKVAAYQFTHPDTLDALRNSRRRGVDVEIVYDARSDTVAEANREAVERQRLKSACSERTANPSNIAHNKFIVLLRNAKPVAVWTGSTNFTEGGIFGHSNVGHVIRDPAVARTYADYWERLHHDPEAVDLREWVSQATPTPEPGVLPPAGSSVLFSPRSGLQLLDWYADLASSAHSLMCMTFAFGINNRFHPVFATPFAGLRYALLDTAGNSEEAKARVNALGELRHNRFAVGNFMSQNRFDRWLHERLSGLNRHARYIHTKYMLVDPLGRDPIVISGSANFSDASVRDNDENMLVIRGNKRVADVYLTEFMRLWNHYSFREWAAKQTKPASTSFRHLEPDDGWRLPYYGNTQRARQRAIFAGTFDG
jgi:phosphatidylserine/phosphatidylglycerophosphate/cardiolipin synthase-like enzyme